MSAVSIVTRDATELGIQHARSTDESWLEKLVEEPFSSKRAVRNKQHYDRLAESEWKTWVENRQSGVRSQT